FGGPYLGFMAATAELTRKLPGRIVGETTDNRGNRCYVLTLQAREQHIRREKASSNICSNQALCAMTAAVYMAAMGPAGMRNVAQQCYDKAHYLATELAKVKGFTPLYQGEFFHEFVSACPVPAETLLARLEAEGILGGLPVEGGILWCATEQNTKAEIDRVVAIAKEVST
ncbi:MAG: aminomethyl-transferring glycine dehydrogenase, partial [Angelakisella sp.]